MGQNCQNAWAWNTRCVLYMWHYVKSCNTTFLCSDRLGNREYILLWERERECAHVRIFVGHVVDMAVQKASPFQSACRSPNQRVGWLIWRGHSKRLIVFFMNEKRFVGGIVRAIVKHVKSRTHNLILIMLWFWTSSYH